MLLLGERYRYGLIFNGIADRSYKRNLSSLNFKRLLHITQGDSLSGIPELTIINEAIIYRLKQNLTSTDDYNKEDAEIGFLLPGGTG